MKDDAVLAAKAKLDKELESAPENAPIAFGIQLYDEFSKRGYFALKEAGAEGSYFLSTPEPFYGEAHLAFAFFGIPEIEFRIGTPKKIHQGT